MFIKIKAKTELYCINTEKIAFISYKEIHDKTEIVFKNGVLCEAAGKKVYDFLIELLAEDVDVNLQS